jgi:hypothetical protein
VVGKEREGMGVSFRGARITDLAFQVFGRTLHPDWFTVRELRRVAQNGWEADVRIIDGGHAVLFRAGESRVAEVLSGAPTELPVGGLMFQSPIRQERSTSLKPSPTLSYQTCFEAEKVDPEVFEHLCQEMSLDTTRGRLFHRFATGNRLAPAPISHIQIDARVSGLSVYSFHTFPDERAIVRTQSLFELRNVLPPR